MFFLPLVIFAVVASMSKSTTGLQYTYGNNNKDPYSWYTGSQTPRQTPGPSSSWGNSWNSNSGYNPGSNSVSGNSNTGSSAGSSRGGVGGGGGGSTSLSLTNADKFNKQCVKEHNKIRKKYGVPALVYSADLAASAKASADEKLELMELVHTDVPDGVGENLYEGYLKPTAKRVKCKKPIKLWYGENSDYHYETPGFSAETGHFTQLVWKDTQEVGCGYATDGKVIFIACHYRTGGNVVGEFQDQVPHRLDCPALK